MAVYVDILRVYPNAWGPFRAGSCHLLADSADELHAFAEAIGMRRSWFQGDRSLPHYDLVPSKRALAVRKGAIEVDDKFVVERMKRAREQRRTWPTVPEGGST